MRKPRKIDPRFLERPSNDESAQRFVEVTHRGKHRTVRALSEGRSPPEILGIDHNRASLLEFLEETRTLLDKKIAEGRGQRRRSRHVEAVTSYWDFTKIKQITPTAALMIASEYDRASTILGTAFPAVDLRNWQPQVVDVLNEVGFLDLLNISNAHRKILLKEKQNSTLRVLKMRSNQLAQSEIAGGLITDLEKLAADLTVESEVNFDRLYGALFEGITNTKHHAYPQDYEFRHAGQWWATGFVDTRTRTISAIMLDHGVTIPASLPKSWMVGALNNLFGSGWGVQDGPSIAAAMQVSRSSTELPNRGLGLAEMEAFMETCAAGKLRIFSRHGEYTAEVGKDAANATHKDAVKGTLVQWDVVV